MKHSFLFSLAFAAILLPSCSVFGGRIPTKSVTGAQATQIVPATVASTVNTSSQEVAPTHTPTPTPVTPSTFSAPPHVENPVASHQPAAVQSALAAELAGEWTIVQVASTIIDRDDDMPYINFLPSGEFYANNGCNTLNGSYLISGESVTFGAVLSTLKYCPDVVFDHTINTVFAEGQSFKIRISKVGQEVFVELLSGAGTSVIKLRRGDLAFLNGHWDVETIAGVASLDTPADLFFDIPELKLHGNTGCNYINGSIYLDHRAPNAIDFSNMGSTRMACPFSAQETAMVVALEQTASAISDGHDRVLLLDENGHKLMVLVRAPVQDDSNK